MLNENSVQRFGKRVRLRACGVLIENDEILLVKHVGLGSDGFFWSPPGGGLEFGESCQTTVEREFLEETGFQVKTSDFLCFNEHIDSNLHAVELFFNVQKIGGELQLGIDPELDINQQMLVDIRFWSKKDIMKLPHQQFHNKILNCFLGS